MLLDLGGAQRHVCTRLARSARVRRDARVAIAVRLEYVQDVLGCGRIVEQIRHDNHRASLLRFSVKRRADLVGIVVPFFTEHPLRTAKRPDFERFATVFR